MARPDRPPRAAVDPLAAMQAEPHRFGLFHALRLIECANPAAPRLGRPEGRAADEPVRLGQEPSLAFAPATLAGVETPGEGRRPRLRVHGFGMFGPNGPMPLHITEHMLDRQRFHGAAHCEQARVINVHGVDLLDLRAADADTTSDGADAALGVQALLEVELLRIVDTGELRVRRKHDGRCDDGAGQRAHADFVDSGDVLHAGAPQDALEVQHRVEPSALGTVALVALLERDVELLDAVPRVALELVQSLRADRLVGARVALADLIHRQFR